MFLRMIVTRELVSGQKRPPPSVAVFAPSPMHVMSKQRCPGPKTSHSASTSTRGLVGRRVGVDVSRTERSEETSTERRSDVDGPFGKTPKRRRQQGSVGRDSMSTFSLEFLGARYPSSSVRPNAGRRHIRLPALTLLLACSLQDGEPTCHTKDQEYALLRRLLLDMRTPLNMYDEVDVTSRLRSPRRIEVEGFTSERTAVPSRKPRRTCLVQEPLGYVLHLSSLMMEGMLSPRIVFFRGLRELCMSHNQLTSLPDALCSMTHLTTLEVSYNRLTSLPESISDLRALVVLKASYNQMTSLPESIGDLRALTSLYVEFNRLTSLPESLFELSALENLFLGGNALTEVSGACGELRSLESLDVSNNRLSALPVELGRLHGSLKFLNVSQNDALTSLPDEFRSLVRMESLNVAYTSISYLNHVLSGMSRLRLLNFTGARLDGQIATAINGMPHLTDVLGAYVLFGDDLWLHIQRRDGLHV
jgi:hypothetical protein